MARVSVVIPCWNAADFIERTLDSVAAQTYRDFEVVAVDDGSTDGTHDVVERVLKARGLPGRSIRQENKKIAGARNAGIRAAAGELVAFLDHDDRWYPEKLARCVAELDADPGAGLVCHQEKVVKDGREVGVTRNGPWTERMYESLLFSGNALSPSAVVARKRTLFEAGLFRENPEFNTVEDYDLWMRLARVCRMRFLGEILGEYALVERGASNKIVYHTSNLESLLSDHFKNFPDPDARIRSLMGRRRGVMCRSAARLLLAQGELAESGRYARRAVSECPADWKNWAALAQWTAKRLLP